MDPALTITLTAFVVVAVTVVVIGAAAYRLLPTIRRDRLAPETALGRGGVSVLRWTAPRAWWQRIVEAVGRQTAPREAENVSKLRQRLGWAGYTSPQAVAVYTGARFLLAAVMGAIVPLASFLLDQQVDHPFLYPIALAYFGFFGPPLMLGRMIKSRKEKITSALPDFLDLLTVCVEAGMSFDAALARIAEQPEVGQSPLFQEIIRMNQEVGAGRPRAEALRAFANRCGVQDVTTMVSVFIQSERLGTSMGRALRVHSDTARAQRRHRIEAQAYVAPLKMIFPTIIFLTPAFFLVALAPSLMGFMAIMGSPSK
jgi:tight adherence protein C